MDSCVGHRMGCLEYTWLDSRPSREIKQIHWKNTLYRLKMSQHLPVARLPQATEKYVVFILHITITTTEILLIKPITILRNV